MTKNKMAKMPLGIQTFAKIREGDFVYVDKTPQALALADAAGMYFLARPRRFGKSLFLDTLRDLFEGKQELFQGLYAEDNWEWSHKYPVIKLDLSGTSGGVSALRGGLEGKLRYAARRLGVELSSIEEPAKLLEQLIREAHELHDRKVVLLIDEYDKPMIDNIGKMDLAQQMCEQLRDFYSIIKATDDHLRFVMLTGVSKFSKVSIFSGLNNLEDISLNPDYGSICGYTEEELSDVFGEHLQGVDRELLRHWYNGYNFLGEKPVYNPYDILNFIKRSRSFGEPSFRSYWFETATPTFVVDLLARDSLAAHKLEPSFANEEIIDSCPIDKIELTTVLFQSGYLTIDEVISSRIPGRQTYRLICPNHSVRSALQNQLFSYYTAGDKTVNYQQAMESALVDARFEKIESELKRLFAGIAADNYRKNDIAHFEGYYASVVYSFFTGLGLTVIAEDVANFGRIDLTVQLDGNTYIIEFKVVKRKSKTNRALQQIIQQGYADKYAGKVYQVGIEFSEARRNIVSFAWQSASIGS